MSVEFTGVNKLLSELERKLGKSNIQRVSDKALTEGAKVFVAELKRQFETFKDTGASIDEITISKPMTVARKRIVKIYWRGPKGRYRIIHLNEWGTINNPNPRGKGKIALALRNAEKAYRDTIVRYLKAGI
ncbi:MAG TPA: hypothetical protein VIG73_08315 [Cerasibacillus sp.]|uniref:hypothetical protein n=1 Tax=Cerasibacillus sp. TaxID=2498711 RepID=UPI002F425FB0